MAQAQAAKRKRGRPPKSGGGAIYGIGKGIRLTWTDGHFRGTDRLVVEGNALVDAAVTLPVRDGNWDVLAFVEVDRYDPTSAVAVIQALIGEGAQLLGDLPFLDLAGLADIDGFEFDGDEFPVGA